MLTEHTWMGYPSLMYIVGGWVFWENSVDLITALSSCCKSNVSNVVILRIALYTNTGLQI